MAASPPEGPVIRPVDRLLGVYAIVSGLVLFLPGRPPSWPELAAFHTVLAWLALCGPGAGAVRSAAARALPRAAGFLHDWYPLLLMPVFYAELEPLNIAVHGGRMFDPWILAFEQTVFGGQPSRDWARAFPRLWLSEPLHAMYLSYYGILYLPALAIWLRRRHDFALVVFTVMLAFVAHYLFFIFLPVEGPRYRFPAPTGGIETGFFYQTAHRILEAGSSRGAAFPSSHVGASIAVAVATLRVFPRLGVFLVCLATGVACGAVYGGFHYATDAIAGLLLGGLLAWSAPAVAARLDRGRHGAA